MSYLLRLYVIQLSTKSPVSNEVFLQKTRQEVETDDDICLAMFVTKQAMRGKFSCFTGLCLGKHD